MKQRIEIEVDVPDGFEATGEWRRARTEEYMLGHNGRESIPVYCYDSSYFETPRFILRKLKSPSEQWLEQHPWLPEGCWVYIACEQYFVTSMMPVRALPDSEYTHQMGCPRINLIDLAAINNKGISPPPVSCIQVLRK